MNHGSWDRVAILIDNLSIENRFSIIGGFRLLANKS